MDSITIHGWQIPLVVRSDETYGMIPPKSLPSMDIPSIHGWKISMSGMQHKVGPLKHPLSEPPSWPLRPPSGM